MKVRAFGVLWFIFAKVVNTPSECDEQVWTGRVWGFHTGTGHEFCPFLLVKSLSLEFVYLLHALVSPSHVECGNKTSFGGRPSKEAKKEPASVGDAFLTHVPQGVLLHGHDHLGDAHGGVDSSPGLAQFCASFFALFVFSKFPLPIQTGFTWITFPVAGGLLDLLFFPWGGSHSFFLFLLGRVVPRIYPLVLHLNQQQGLFADCEWCLEATSSVMQANLLLFKLLSLHGASRGPRPASLVHVENGGTLGVGGSERKLKGNPAPTNECSFVSWDEGHFVCFSHRDNVVMGVDHVGITEG